MYRVARADRAGRLHFAPLQGATARTHLPPERLAALDTAVLLDADGLHVRSRAMLRTWALLPWPWRALAALRLVPRWLRDAVYDWVATQRTWLRLGPFEWRGPLTEAERARFLP